MMLVAVPFAKRSIVGKLLGRFPPSASSIARPRLLHPRSQGDALGATKMEDES